MLTPRLNQLSIDLSRLLNDEVDASTTDGEEFKASQRLLALNRAESQIISKAVAEQDLRSLERNFNELLAPFSFGAISSGVESPAGSAKVISLRSGSYYMIPVKASDWLAVETSYNGEQLDNYGTLPQFQWTEFGKRIYFKPDPVTISLNGIYLKDHIDLTYNGDSDFLVPARFDPEVLKLAYEFLTQILVKE